MTNKPELTDNRVHELKIYPQHFADVKAGIKRAELRLNDRNYHTGDVLRLCEYDAGELTGAAVDVDVVHVADVGYWCSGYVLLSIDLRERRKSDSTEPVAWLHADNGIGIPAITRSRNVANSWLSKGWNIQPLYTRPQPVLAVPDEVLICDMCGHDAWHKGGRTYECTEGHVFEVRAQIVEKAGAQ